MTPARARLPGIVAVAAGLLVAVPAVVRFAERARADQGLLPVSGAPFFVVCWAAALLFAGLYGILTAGSWRRVAGMALMVTPLAFTLLGILNDLAPLLAGGVVLRARSTYRLSSLFIRKILIDLGYLGAGFILWSGWTPAEGLRGLARRLQATGIPVGRSEGRGVRLGFAWFPVLILVTVVTDIILRGSLPQLVNSDERSIWDNMTPYHAVLISAAAAVGEEAVYRMLLMGGIGVMLLRAGATKPWAWGVAMVVQAVVFGFAHSSYGNWLHLIQATSFALIAGAALMIYGIWGAIMLHFLVDIYAIGRHADATWWLVGIGMLLLFNVGYTLYRGGSWAWRRRASSAG